MSVMNVGERIKSDFGRLVSIRHDLHAHPELAFQEKRTSGVVMRELGSLGIEHVGGLAKGTGIVAWLPATEKPGIAPTVALRADMDALPIIEDSGAKHASTIEGVMHACGHDGHTTILLGVARALSGMARPNNVMLIFQPAEEGGGGGDLLCREGALAGKVIGKKVDHIYGLHGWPSLELGTVMTKSGPFMAATDDFHVVVRGKGGHAAYPHLCVDPIVVGARIVDGLQTIASRRVSPTDNVVCTVAIFRGGDVATNVIPDEVKLSGTIRTLRETTRAYAEAEFRKIVSGIAAAHGATAEIRWEPGYPATVNDEAATERFLRVAGGVLPRERIVVTHEPTMGGEDFSYYGAHAKASYFFLGLRPSGREKYPGLHTPGFDFNDEAMPLGVELMVRLAVEGVD
ncbi:MAG TPA: M20 family metallopeptidase [Phycisphaerales bacterium]|nr:M20 family metallopeptidase [Phycisphaerales bacterium]